MKPAISWFFCLKFLIIDLFSYLLDVALCFLFCKICTLLYLILGLISNQASFMNGCRSETRVMDSLMKKTELSSMAA
jgi:hypothetical protein